MVHRSYVDATKGGRLGAAAWADEEPCKTAPHLRAAQADVDWRLMPVVDGLDADGLDRIVAVHRETHVQRERMDRLLLHLFQHQVQHRGQAHAMLSGTSVAPPQLDEFFPAGEAELRAPDFEALGWSEATVWSREGRAAT